MLFKAAGFFICCFISATAVCSAETYSQKEGLFKIDVPEGWYCFEQPGKVEFQDRQKQKMYGIVIKFTPSENFSKEEAKEQLKKDIQEKEILKHLKPSQEEREIAGVYARQLIFHLPLYPDIIETQTEILFYTKGHAFKIIYGECYTEDEILQMEGILATLRFE